MENLGTLQPVCTYCMVDLYNSAYGNSSTCSTHALFPALVSLFAYVKSKSFIAAAAASNMRIAAAAVIDKARSRHRRTYQHWELGGLTDFKAKGEREGMLTD